MIVSLDQVSLGPSSHLADVPDGIERHS
jgi:hypothetical protein